MIPTRLAAAAALALVGPAVPSAAAAELLTGAQAFGGAEASAPGVRRLIRPGDLPAPYATRSASNAPATVPRPAGALPAVPEGWTVEEWASGFSEPRVVTVAPDGAVLVADSGAGEIVLLSPGPDGRPARSVFASGLERPYGIALWPPGPEPTHVYVGETDKVVRLPWDGRSDAPTGPAETVVPSLPDGGHWTRDLAVSPDGRTLFVAVGSQSNVGGKALSKPPEGFVAANPVGAAWGDEEGRAAVLAFDPGGGGRRLYATGLRNCSGLTVQPATGALWCVVNERDGLGDDLPPDYATRVAEGGFYGWPWYYIGANEDPRHAGARPDLADAVTVPDVLFQAHSAPLGIAFDATGDAYVAMHGSWNRDRRTGYKLVRLEFEDGRATGVHEDVATGFVLADGGVWGRPVDVAVAADGALLVSDDGGGRIWRLVPPAAR